MLLVQLLSFGEHSANDQQDGFIRANLEARGEMIGSNDLRFKDLWIAAHVLAAGLMLVTNNEKEFRRVRGLKVQNWAT
jgi:tRNA(fMet)-specific endonuclease VapC